MSSSVSYSSPVRPTVTPSGLSNAAYVSPPLTPLLGESPLPHKVVRRTAIDSRCCQLLIPQLLSTPSLTVSRRHADSGLDVLHCCTCLEPVGLHSQLSVASLDSLLDAKLINDPIHGHIRLHPEILSIIDTPHFQRLRDLKQLGTCYYVFPGACHNRFEHSIGTMHLAGEMIDHFRRTQPELRITDREAYLVRCAGLLHDLGHGPFSHVFDNEFIRQAIPGCKWTHEHASIMMLNDLIERYNLNFTRDERFFLEEMIDSKLERRTSSKLFLYQIVANARNSIDVDKLDYLRRDSTHLGMSSNLRHERLIKNSRVIDNEICFNSKEVYNIYELFHTRYSLHKQVYSHRVSKAIEYMICDVLLLADPILKISTAIHEPTEYIRLTDCIVKEIEISRDERLKTAQSLIERIRRRDIYKLVDESIIPVHRRDIAKIRSTDILAFVETSELAASGLKIEDIQVQNLEMNYAMKDKNPVDEVKFFDKTNPNQSYSIPKHKVSSLTPEHFQERIYRVFLKDVTEAKFNALKKASFAFLKHHQCLSPAAGLGSRSNSFGSGAYARFGPIDEDGKPISGIAEQWALKPIINATPFKEEKRIALSTPDSFAFGGPTARGLNGNGLKTIAESPAPAPASASHINGGGTPSSASSSSMMPPSPVESAKRKYSALNSPSASAPQRGFSPLVSSGLGRPASPLTRINGASPSIPSAVSSNPGSNCASPAPQPLPPPSSPLLDGDHRPVPKHPRLSGLSVNASGDGEFQVPGRPSPHSHTHSHFSFSPARAPPPIAHMPTAPSSPGRAAAGLLDPAVASGFHLPTAAGLVKSLSGSSGGGIVARSSPSKALFSPKFSAIAIPFTSNSPAPSPVPSEPSLSRASSAEPLRISGDKLETEAN